VKKHVAHKKLSHSKNNYSRYFLIAFLVLVLSLSLVTIGRSYANQKIARSSVLGEESLNKENGSKEQMETKERPEKVEGSEPTEVPEPTESPEPKEPQEQEAEKIHQEVEQKTQRGQIERIEVAPGKGNQQTGTLKLEQTNGQTTEKQIPASQTPVATLQSAQLGNVSLSVNANGTVSLVNAGVRIETNYPVVIDPQTKTVAIRTETGVTIINMFPSQILPRLSPADKPTITQSVSLTNENNQPTYLISGKQNRRFVGIFPIEASIKTRVSAKDGSVLSVDEPWYFRNLGFLYSI
jgi:hypothetical protein